MARALALLALVLAMPASASAASLSGTVFNDYDADGVRAASEPPLEGIAVTAGGITAVSAGDGSWSIHGLEAGAQRLAWTPPENGVCTTLGCEVDVAADTAGIHLGVQLGGLLIDPGGALAIGHARLIAPRAGCRRTAFLAGVDGDGITRVEYRVDGRRVAVSRRRGFRARIPVARLDPGRHRLVAVARYGSTADTPAKRLQMTFRRCA